MTTKKELSAERYEDTFYGIGVKTGGVEHYLDGMETFGDDGIIGQNG